jgi:hypothetical protein
LNQKSADSGIPVDSVRQETALAPLVTGETIWLGFDAPRDAQLEGKTSAGDAIRIEQIGGYHAGRGLFAASRVNMPTGASAIDGALVFSRRGHENGLSLLFDIVTPSNSQRRLVVAFMAVDRFAQMTGVGPPLRSIDDTYGGWRLP